METKDLKNIVKASKKEVKEAVYSPYFIINTLNKAVKGDVKKISGLEGVNFDNLKELAKEVKKLHSCRYPFDLCLFSRNEVNGHFLLPFASFSKKCPVFGVNVLEVNEKGFKAFHEIKPTFNAYISAFAYLVRTSLKEAEKAAKANLSEAEKAEKKEAAMKAQKAKEITLQMLSGEITPELAADMIKALK